MELNEYIKQSERTMIDKGFSMNMLHASLGIVTETAELLDAYKKHIFYGKELDLVNIKEEIGDIFWYLAIVFREIGLNSDSLIVNLTNKINFTTLRKEGLHNKIDICYLLFISSNNLARTLYSHYFLDKNKKLQPLTDNIINLVEKTTLDILKFCYFNYIDPEETLQINIDKLAKRYPDKFDSNLALNRDLKAEREVLEGLNTKTEQVDYIDLHLQSGLREYRQNLGLTIDQLADLLKVTPVDIKHYENLRVPMTVKQAQELIKWDQQQREKQKNKSLLYYANAHIEPSITIEDFHTKTEQVDYISELHDKGLYVDNSGIDSRVPKVVVDGSN